jgi:hypothetical protein
MFTATRRLGTVPDDLPPLGARRTELFGIARVGNAYVFGDGEPTVLVLHGGNDSMSMVGVAEHVRSLGATACPSTHPGTGCRRARRSD